MANIYDQNLKLQAIADAITNQSITITTGQDLLDALADIAAAMQPAAANISYDNTNSGLRAVNVQQAVDENADSISTLNSSITELDGRIKSGQIVTSISSGIANLRTDGKPILYVTSGVDGWYYSLGRSGNTVWVKCFNYDGTVISDRTNITFYYFYLDM